MRCGARPGAGRKRKTELQSARDAIRGSIAPRDWYALVRKLYQDAWNGNASAAGVLFRYVFYNPARLEPSATRRQSVPAGARPTEESPGNNANCEGESVEK